MENKKSNVFNILLILIVIGLIGFILYDKFIEKDTNQNSIGNNTTTTQTTTIEDTKKNETTTVEAKKDEIKVPMSDLTALSMYSDPSGAFYFYGYIEEGELYYSQSKTDNDKIRGIGFLGYSDRDKNITKYTNINNIRRIKIFNEGSSVSPYVYLITEDGKVYNSSVRNNINFQIVNDLKDYQVEDLLGYKLVIGNASAHGDYKLLLKDGTTQDIQVNY